MPRNDSPRARTRLNGTKLRVENLEERLLLSTLSSHGEGSPRASHGPESAPCAAHVQQTEGVCKEHEIARRAATSPSVFDSVVSQSPAAAGNGTTAADVGAESSSALVDLPTFSDPTAITNPFFPFDPGAVKVFRGQSDGAQVVSIDEYLTETRTFQWNGSEVTTRILVETTFEDGQLVEVSQNYFAQADDGTVYYFGEVVDNYEGGVIVNHDGSWLVGGPTLPSDPADTAVARHPAVFMPDSPSVGDTFKPEDLFPFVDETVVVQRTGVKVTVPAGQFRGAIQVEETSRLSTGFEHKWYAPGVGVVKVKGPGETLFLVSTTLDSPAVQKLIHML